MRAQIATIAVLMLSLAAIAGAPSTAPTLNLVVLGGNRSLFGPLGRSAPWLWLFLVCALASQFAMALLPSIGPGCPTVVVWLGCLLRSIVGRGFRSREGLADLVPALALEAATSVGMQSFSIQHTDIDVNGAELHSWIFKKNSARTSLNDCSGSYLLQRSPRWSAPDRGVTSRHQNLG